MTTFTWSGVSADWTSATDWSSGNVPTASDSALINTAGPGYTLTVGSSDNEGITAVTLDSGSATLAVDGTLTVSGTVTVDAGALLLNGGTVVITSGGGLVMGTSVGLAGTVAVDGASSLLTVAAGITDGSTASGLLQVTNGGTIELTGTKGINIGASAGSFGSMVVSGASALVSFGASAKGITVGNAGSGTVDVLSGGTIAMNGVGGLGIGQASGAVGLVMVSGVGALINEGAAGNGMGVGQAGQGTLEVLNGGTVSLAATGSGDGIGVGQTAGGSGLIQVSGSGALLSLNTPNAGMSVGQSGQGTLEVQNAGAVSITGKGLGIGTAAGGSGTVSVSGSGASITTLGTAGGITVGGVAAGQLSISSTGTVSSSAGIFIAQSSSAASGTLTVDDGTLLDTGALTVGNLGSGTLTVQDAAAVTITGSVGAGVDIGMAATGSGTVTIDNASLTETGGIFAVGASGKGSLTVQNAGTLSTSQISGPAGDIGSSTGGFGTATVTGATSLWTVGGQLVVGDQGSGSLTITNGGVVNAGANDIDVGNQSGASGAIVVNTGNAMLEGGALNLDHASGQNAAASLTIGTGGTVLVTSATVDNGAAITLSGGLLDPTVLSINTGGAISGFGILDAGIGNSGTITAAGGTLDVTGGITGSGTLAISSGATLQLDGPAPISANVLFNTGIETLMLGSPSTGFSSTINGINTGDIIAFNFGVGVTIANASLTGQIITLTESNAQTYALTDVNFAPLSLTNFTLGQDGSTGDATLQIGCFAEGTRIATERGDVAVEALCIGDRIAVMHSKAIEPVIWIGRRHVDCTRHPNPKMVWPVCISAGAFGPGRPHRDLWLSPDHAVFVEGVLIPIRRLINGASVAQVARETINYYHVELSQHGVVLAEGMPAESYLDAGERDAFANGDGVMQLHANFAPPIDRMAELWEARGCAPLAIVGPAVEAARRLLTAVQETTARGAGATRGA